LRSKVARMARLLHNKQYVNNWKNVYSVYSKMQNWEQKYQQLVNRVNKLKGLIGA
jgi:sulfur transfer protein SufE